MSVKFEQSREMLDKFIAETGLQKERNFEKLIEITNDFCFDSKFMEIE